MDDNLPYLGISIVFPLHIYLLPSICIIYTQYLYSYLDICLVLLKKKKMSSLKVLSLCLINLYIALGLAKPSVELTLIYMMEQLNCAL